MIVPQDREQPIELLKLSLRPYSCLKRAGIHTIGDLMRLSHKQLRSIRNLGDQSYAEVKAHVISYGFMPNDHPIGPFVEDELL